jgi:anthranilate phosphoribosyltransferase
MSLDDFGGWPGLLRPLAHGDELTADQTQAAMAEILGGTASPAQIAAFIVALRIKGESVPEMTGLVRAMLGAATPLDLGAHAAVAIDIVGAGGAPARQLHALNVSTMASFVAAGAGARVCKHGNRRASSTSGAFDFLELLGIPVETTPDQVARCVDEAGVGFAFARTFHPAMRFAAPVRAEIGIPTVFNVLGPLANPARVRRSLVGIGDAAMAAKMVRVLAANGSERAWVVTGDGPIDEVSLTGPTAVQTLDLDGTVSHRELTPEMVGITRVRVEDVAGGDAARNVEIFTAVLKGQSGPFRDIIVLNAAAALVVSDVAADLADGVTRAAAAIDDGSAERALDTVRRIVNSA